MIFSFFIETTIPKKELIVRGLKLPFLEIQRPKMSINVKLRGFSHVGESNKNHFIGVNIS